MEKNILVIKTYLDTEDASKYEKVKEASGIRADSEFLRYLITEAYNRLPKIEVPA